MKKVVSLVWMIFLLIFLLIASLTSCGRFPGAEQEESDAENRNTVEKYSETYLEAFDTVTVITGYDVSETAFKEKADELFEALMEYHRLYDIYHTYDGMNNLKTVNDNAGIKPVQVDERILDMLEYGLEMYKTTEGKTNIAMGSVLKIWHRCRSEAETNPEKAALPERAQLRNAAKHMDISNVILDKKAKTVYLQDSEMSLDVGALAKGYATDRLSDIAVSHGWNHILLSVGGNLKAVGAKPSQEPWKVGIQAPDSWQKSYFCLLNLVDESLVTSGSYQRYYTINGKRYHHIIDPDTLMPNDTFVSVSLVCESSAMGDALSTAFFNMSQEQGQELVERLPEVEAVWLYEDGSYVYSSGLENKLME